MKHSAVSVIQRNALVHAELQAWSWWRLFAKVKPLIKVHSAKDIERKEVCFRKSDVKCSTAINLNLKPYMFFPSLIIGRNLKFHPPEANMLANFTDFESLMSISCNKM